MKFIAKLQEFKKYLGMDAEIRNKKGDLLDSVTINNKGKNLKFNFDKDDALNGKKKTKLTISFTDTNGADGNLRKSNGDLSDLSPDSQTFKATLKREDKKGQTQITLTGTPLDPNPPKPPADTTPPVFTSGATASVAENIVAGTTIYTAQATDDSPPLSFSLTGPDAGSFSIASASNFSANVTINSSPDFETKSSYAFNVVASDNVGNTSTQGVSLAITDVEEGKTEELTPQLDTITAAQLSSQDDFVNGELGTLGNGNLDSIVDGSTTDNDLLVVKTNGNFDIDKTLDDAQINRIQNIENIRVIADNDDKGSVANYIDLSNIVNLKKLDVDGTFTRQLRFEDWANPGATEFDFSGITSSQGTLLAHARAGNQNFTGNLVFKGSAGQDSWGGLLGNVTMQGFSGNDILIGSKQGTSIMEGGAGTDNINLWTHNAQHVVRLNGQTSSTSKDTIIASTFQGFNNLTAQNLNTFDLIEIDAATFSNYSAGQPVAQEADVNVNAATNLSNTVVTSVDQLTLTGNNFDNNGNGILGFAEKEGMLIYSASGNFAADAQELLEIGITEGPNFVPTRQINVV